MEKSIQKREGPSSRFAAGRNAYLIIGLMLLAVLVTRMLTLTHNMGMHPDEFVFFYSSESLAHKLLGIADQYTEVKEYPEGAFVFQAPFHMAAWLLQKVTGRSLYIQTVGRLSAVFYFLAAAGFGGSILERWFPKRKWSLPIYALTVTFSLIHMEQSRYGTADAISACLLMALVLFCASAQDSAGTQAIIARLLAASFTAGALSAVKYPLVFFFILPIVTALRSTRKGKTSTRAFLLSGMAILMVMAFFICSPKAAADPMYVVRVIQKEMGNYVAAGNLCEVGGPWNHLLSVILYLTLYSGFPLASVFLVTSGVREIKRSPAADEKGALFNKIIPCALLVFLFYNLFSTTLFMRSIYPFFCLSDLYVASEAARWIEEKGTKKRVVLVLLTFLLVRGGYHTAALTEKRGTERLNEMILTAASDNWQHTILLGPGYFLPFDDGLLTDPEAWDTDDARYRTEEALKLNPGDMVLCATQEHSRNNPYFFPTHYPVANLQIERWQTFKTVNKAFYKGQVYPEHYYWLFGYWIKGTTGTDYEFPSNRLYYCG